MTIEERYRELQQRKYQEDLERQKYLGAAQNAATQVEASIAKLQSMVQETEDERIRGLFTELIQFYDKDRLMDKKYAAELFKKCRAVESAIEKLADELVG